MTVLIVSANVLEKARQRVRDAVTATIPNVGAAAAVLVAVEMLEREATRAERERILRQVQARSGGGLGLG